MSQNIKDIMNISDVKITDLTANPAPLGLMGFGMTTVLLNIHNAGFYPMNAMILSMGIFYGGIAQVIAGIMEWKKGNTFGTTAFTSYGLFWLSLVGIVLLPKSGDNFTGFATDAVTLCRIPLHVGDFHPLHVHRYTESNKGSSGCFPDSWQSCSSCLPLEITGQPGNTQDRWL